MTQDDLQLMREMAKALSESLEVSKALFSAVNLLNERLTALEMRTK
jgi:hypothetical protein